MKVINTHISGLKIIEPEVFGDDRGFFLKHILMQNIVKNWG